MKSREYHTHELDGIEDADDCSRSAGANVKNMELRTDHDSRRESHATTLLKIDFID